MIATAAEQEQFALLDAVQSPLVVVCEGIVVYANPACRLQEFDKFVVGKPFATALGAGYEGLNEELHTHPHSAAPQRALLVSTVRGDVWVTLAWSPLRLANNTEARLLTIMDISELHSLEEWLWEENEREQLTSTLAASETRLKHVLSHLPINIFTIDQHGIVTYSDGTLMPRDVTLVGRSIFEIHAQEVEFIADTQRVLAGETIERERYWSDRVILTHYMPLYDEQRRQVGALGMGVDITERKRMEQAMMEHQTLRANLQKEIELSHLKSRMMQRIAHEFRTPLSVIQLSAQMLDRYIERMTSEQRGVRIEHILRQTRHLTQLMEDITLVVRAQSQNVGISRYQFDLEQLIMAHVDEISKNQNIVREWQIDIAAEMQVVYADARLVGLMLQHLLSNAVKYSDEGSVIAVRAWRDGVHWRIAITDQGIGILESEQKYIFEPFFRGSNFDERPGLGLGLSIVRDAVRQHSGEIEVESAPGAGTTFTIILHYDTPA
jgi:signal transduction histidine kinase